MVLDLAFMAATGFTHAAAALGSSGQGPPIAAPWARDGAQEAFAGQTARPRGPQGVRRGRSGGRR